MANIGAPTRMLNDVVIIRPLAIFLLVVWHSFIIYTGGWKAPVGYKPIEWYWWIGKASYAFMLELFVFMSGYVFALSLQTKNSTFKSVLIGKLKRLIVPSLVFSSIYYLIFYDLTKFSLWDFILNILNGCGHLWFLPMLFWTTIICYFLDRAKMRECVKLVFVLCVVPFSLLPLPFGISSALYYALFFYVGMLIFRGRYTNEQLLKPHIHRVILLGGGFLLLFVMGTLLDRDVLSDIIANSSLIFKGIAILCSKYVRVVYALCGVIFIYELVNFLLHVKNWEVPKWLQELNKTCFGIYLFQQFILQFLYYKSSLPSLVGPYWLPWIGLVVALLVSYALTKISLKTSIGRQLM